MEQNNIIPTIKNMIKRTQNGRKCKEKWQEEEDFQPPQLGTSHNLLLGLVNRIVI
jgi:hypothetical protein